MFYINLSQKIYNPPTFAAYRRSIVFLFRTMLHYDAMEKLRLFLGATPLRAAIAANYPIFFEQLTRAVFYRGSTVDERLQLITSHLSFFEANFISNVLEQIYQGESIPLWQDSAGPTSLSLELAMHDNYLREGMMGLIFKCNKEAVYTLPFWVVAPISGSACLTIGTLQGKRNGLSLQRRLTKHCHGFRPKNFILFALCTLAQRLSIAKIYAVSTYGHYANNHLRFDRKLKTSLDPFWLEVGGTQLADRRFFELPLVPSHKRLEDVVTHKRNLYRKRYALLASLRTYIYQSIDAISIGPER